MARSFNGTSEKISGSGQSNNPAQLTVSVWVNPSSFPNAYNACAWGEASAGNSKYAIYAKSSGLLAMYYNGSTPNHYDGTGTHTLVANTWYHLLFLGTSGANVTGYVNGSLDGTGGAAYSNADSTTGNWQISNDSVGTRWWAGLIADQAIWSTALTAAEISALANGARPYTIRPTLLISYWPLDGLQSPEPDLSGNKLNGTLTGTASGFGPPLMQFSPRSPHLIKPTVAAGPSFQPAWAMRKNIIVEGFAT